MIEWELNTKKINKVSFWADMVVIELWVEWILVQLFVTFLIEMRLLYDEKAGKKAAFTIEIVL